MAHPRETSCVFPFFISAENPTGYRGGFFSSLGAAAGLLSA
jgi:hypothetical protein